ncbi:MAG TPA: TatD family hydrolase [Verrucomicrobiales bacterium]|jgi:TatD DNase family protein|nr:TatD family hydrolase [Verrucomicrobiales bacterium]
MLTDTHAHLESHSLRNELPAIIDRALAAGVSRIVAIGCDLPSSRACLEIADRFPNVWATVGVHPCYVTEVTEPDWLAQLHTLSQHPRCAGLGEMGLDYYHNPPEGWGLADYQTRQQEFFRAQLELAAEVKKNVVVHQRDRTGMQCWRDIVKLVTPFQGNLRAVFHCWILPWEEAAPMVAAGHLISFTGIATYPKAPEVAACAAAAADGSFMLETDSPYIAPVPHRGKRNEPAFVRHTAERIAELRGVSLESLASATSRTADDFFSLPPA